MSEYPEGAIPVLDHGFVKLVDHMGDDSSIVQAARVSYGKGTKQVNEDRGLIRYLMRHLHTTPFEMVEFKFHCKMPIFIARQWIRHRTASVNEISGRYSEMKDEFYNPVVGKVTKQSQNNKQGGTDEVVDDPILAITEMALSHKRSSEEYQKYLGMGMRKELARVNLPLSTYTEWYWKIDLHNLFHFLKLRLDSHAQYEIRVFGEAMAELIKPIVPLAWEAFEDYQLKSVKFSKLDIECLKNIIKVGWFPSGDQDQLVELVQKTFDNKREKEEFIKKLEIFTDRGETK